MFEQSTSNENIKKVKNFFKNNSQESIAILATFCYFSGQRKSELFRSIIQAKIESGYEVIFLVDEGESLLNSFYSSIIIDRPQDRLFKTICRGNSLAAIDSSKSNLSLNCDLNSFNEDETIKGAISAVPGDPQIFENYHFDSFTINKNQLVLNIETKKPVFSDFIVFCNIKKISISHKIFITTHNKEGMREILSLDENNTLNFSQSLFQTLEMLDERNHFDCCFSLAALIDNILNSTAIYIQYYAVTSSLDIKTPLSYKDACDKYEIYKSIKSNNKKAKLSDYLKYPTIGKLYQVEIIFNRSSSLTEINRCADRVFYISATWNTWLLDACYYSKPLGFNITDEKMQIDLYKLVILISSFSYEDVNSEMLLHQKESAKKTKLSERFSEFSNLNKQANKLKI